MEKFTIGLALGTLVGAAIVANSQKTRKLFIKSQDELKSRVDEMIDEKLEMLEEASEEDDEEETPKTKPKRTGFIKSKK
jgi:hypothetical protein